jgi:hypothetical protein
MRSITHCALCCRGNRNPEYKPGDAQIANYEMLFYQQLIHSYWRMYRPPHGKERREFGSGAARLAAIPAGESPANRGVQSLL